VTRLRAIAALAAIITALLVQATVVAPLTVPVPVSLPALVVAAVALVDGPGTGLTLGFAMGLVADLSSVHPAGVLALAWLVVGIVCGLGADGTSVRLDAAIAAGVCAVVGAGTTVALAVLGSSGASLGDAAHQFIPTLLGDALLGLVVVPLVRHALASPTLRALRPAPPLVLAERP
jgi:rod shape-determining protein MreD